VAYIPALGVLGREIVARRDGTAPLSASVASSLAPYRDGQLTPKPKSGSEQAGHLIFAELAKRATGAERERWITLCRAAADQIFDDAGKPKAPMPFHNEMSDAFFMATPIVCATGALTGEEKYFSAALGHFRAMEKLCLRDDGIYRHSPLDQAAWGRGNGFAALGTCLSLCELPADHAARAELLVAHLRHLRALLKHQDAGGAWRQVIDRPESYREFTSTCMISFALVRGD
jgi:unsaturated rhamnogalacturonyl hydrolase